jgi:hypothetical protein
MKDIIENISRDLQCHWRKYSGSPEIDGWSLEKRKIQYPEHKAIKLKMLHIVKIRRKHTGAPAGN